MEVETLWVNFFQIRIKARLKTAKTPNWNPVGDNIPVALFSQISTGGSDMANRKYEQRLGLLHFSF